jgi:hypothetical protein
MDDALGAGIEEHPIRELESPAHHPHFAVTVFVEIKVASDHLRL